MQPPLLSKHPLTIARRYRRGKESSNDVDILITYPHRDGEERGVLQALVERMQQKSAHIAPLTSSSRANPLEQTSSPKTASLPSRPAAQTARSSRTAPQRSSTHSTKP